jgi:hypothetical protein
MSEKRDSSIEEADFKTQAHHEVHAIDANPAAAALAAATEAQKPRMFSKGMIKLWLIVSSAWKFL